jgi:catalase
LVRAAASLHAEDDDFGQARTLIREVFDDAARTRFVATLAGQVAGLTRPEVKRRFFEYWTLIDPDIAQRVRREAGGGADLDAAGGADLDDAAR